MTDKRETYNNIPLWSEELGCWISCNGFYYPTLSRYPYRSDGRVESICDFCSNDISCGECVFGEP